MELNHVFNKILAGVDDSENSYRALQVAAEMTLKFDAALLVFHAVNHNVQLANFSLPMYRGPVVDSTLIKDWMEAAGKDVLNKSKKFVQKLEYASEIKVDYHLELDKSPEDFAVDYATENGVDLIVLGCKGHHGRFRRVLLGTVPTRISNEAPCQVLLVR
jgi:nucleotide-binding universal stress UspA family protein